MIQTEKEAFIFGFITSLLICIAIMLIFTVNIYSIKNGKEFIMYDASYICKKTNQLLGSKNERI